MPVSMGPHPRYLEELRLGGGYGSSPDGGADLDGAGNFQTDGGIDCDGNGAFGGDLSVAGDFQLDGLNTSWRAYLPANLGVPDPALPCGPVSATNWRNYHVVTPSLAFDPDTPQAAFFQIRLPKGYDGRPLKFTLEWSATAGTSGDVRWGVLPISFVDASSLYTVGTPTYVVDSFHSVNALHVCAIESVPTSYAELSMTTVRIVRLSNDASDTFNESSLLLGLEVSM